MIDFPYKVYNIKDYLTDEEILKFENEIDKFDVSQNNFKTPFSPLFYHNNLTDILKQKNPDLLNKIKHSGYYDYDDFKSLVEINKSISNYNEFYFNFRLSPLVFGFEKTYIHKIYEKVFVKIVENIFNKKPNCNQNFISSVINVYPKGSFLSKHQDGEDLNNPRIFTMLFFINKNWDEKNGSLFRMYDEKDNIIDVIPNYENVIVLNHMKYNYVHEVTENISDKIRYSIFSPLSINDLENYFN